MSTIIAPLLLFSLGLLITMGLLSAESMQQVPEATCPIFTENLIRGYETLDILGALFFSAIMLSLLKNSLGIISHNQPRLVPAITLKASLLCTALLGTVYFGLALLGAYHGTGLEGLGAGELFRVITFRIVGTSGTAFIAATIVLTACLSTSVALSAVVAEYIQSEIFLGRIKFGLALFLVLVACIPLSIQGFDHLLSLTTGMLTYIGYPSLITLTICNIAYKLWGFKPVKGPVAATALITLLCYHYL